MKTLAAAIVCGLAALATIGAYTVASWWGPMVPLLAGLAGVTLPVLALVLGVERDLRRNPTMVMTTLGVALLMGAFPSLWLSPQIRSNVVQRFADPAAVVAALRDGDASVRTSACRALFSSGMSSVEIAHELERHPSVAVTCLDAANPSHVSVAAKILSAWQTSLVTESSEQCLLVDHTAALPGVDANLVGLGTLHCALGGANVETKRCCAKQLTALRSAEQAGKWLEKAPKELAQRRMLGRLLLVAFEEPDTLSATPGITSAGLGNADVQNVALEQACEAMLTGRGAEQVESALRWVFAKNASCLTAEEAANAEQLPGACRSVLQSPRSTTVSSRVCQANQRARRDDIEERKAREAAVRKDYGVMAHQIAAGNRMIDALATPAGYSDEDEDVYTGDDLNDGEFDDDMKRINEIAERKLKAARRKAKKDR